MADLDEDTINVLAEHGNLAYHAYADDPKHEYEAGPEWDAADVSEIKHLDDFQVFGEIMKIEFLDAQVLPFRIVYKSKFNPDGSLDKMKVRYAVRGDMDHNKTIIETYAGCIELPLNLLALSLTAFSGKKARMIDVTSA